MPDTFLLKLLTPYQKVFEGEVEAVILPGELGEFGVLAGHTKFVTTLIPGALRYMQEGRTHRLAVSGGFAEAHPHGVTVLADAIERPEDIDLQRAKASQERALQMLQMKDRLEERDLARAEARLARALNRMRMARQLPAGM